MSNFKPIETQEQLDEIIGARVKREQDKFAGFMSPEDVKKKYEGFLSPADVEEKYKGFLSPSAVEEKYKGYISAEDAAAKDAKIKAYENSSVKMKIAHEVGLPYELAERLTGDNEDAIRKDAETLASFTKMSESGQMRSTEPSGGDGMDSAYRTLAAGLSGED